MLAKLNKFLPLGISFNEVFLPRYVNSLSDGDTKYASRLPKILRAAQKRTYNGNDGVVNGTWC